MSKKSGSKKRPSELELFQSLRDKALTDDDSVIELGPSSRTDGAAFEKMRARLSHGEVLARGFDTAVKSRMSVNREGSVLPPEVDETTFDAEVVKVRNMTDNEFEILDEQLMRARGETHAEGGGIHVNRTSGFGNDVFGFAYEVNSGRWSMTNEFGMHGHCAGCMRIDIQEGDGKPPIFIEGFVFKIDCLQTPVMNVFGRFWHYPDIIRKGLADLWAWKKFLIIEQVEIRPGQYQYRSLLTPDAGVEFGKKLFR
jgi:hypothetical protein